MANESLIYLAALFLVIGLVTSYFNMKRNKKFKMVDSDKYKVTKSKGYDYNNPKRFFCEPLMRYVWTPMALSGLILGIIAVIIVVVFHDDGGKGLITNYPWTEYPISVLFFVFLGCVIAYSILYFIRSWNDHEKWRMQDA